MRGWPLAETDILNTSATDPLNPDYGWQKKRPVTHLVAKANAGPAYVRDIMDVTHQFVLNWGTTIDSQKSFSDIQRLKRYYEQYRDGFFTIQDLEGSGRHYVGRFTSPVEPIPVGHNRWAAQNVLFEEVPGVPMLSYPSDWTNDAIWRYTLTDFGELQPAPDVPSNWTVQTCTGPGGGYEIVSNVATSYVQLAYVGYGFQVWSARDRNRGIAQVLLDGNIVGNVDQYSAAGNVGAELLLTEQNVSLGFHVVRIMVTGTKNVASAGTLCSFNALKVMR
jgi:hypothetical protein